MKHKVIIMLFLLVTLNHYAQKRELGSVTQEELKEKFNPKDSSAVATVIFEKGKTYFEYKQDEGFFLVTEVETKIKIYKKEGYDWANKEVSFYIGGKEKETVSFSKAITYNLVNGQIEKTKAKNENEFIEQKNKYWSVKKLAMPNVKEGSILEFKYVINSPYISKFPDWNFQKEIPVTYSEYCTEIPEYFFYNVYRKGYLVPTETKEGLSRLLRLDAKNAPATMVGGYVHNVENINYIDNRTTYVLENVPALKEESFVNNIENYKTAIQHEHAGTQMPQQAYKAFATSWESVAQTIYENDDFGAQLNRNNYYENDINTLLKGVSTPEEKVGVLYAYVQSRMNWDKYYGYYCDAGVKKAYETKTGNAAEINLMLVSMLRFAGLEANPVLISTRKNGISLFPSRFAFDFVIAAVTLNDSYVLLDATSKIAIPNNLPIRDLNWFGRMIRKDGTSDSVALMPKEVSLDAVNMLATIDKSGQMQGKVREQYLDYNALSFRDKNSGVSKESIAEKIEKRHKGLEVTEYELNNTNLGEPVVEKYAVKSENECEIIGDKMFFSPMLFFAMTENPFKQEKREYPIDFTFPFKEKYMVNITVPEGYQVESLPKGIALTMPDKSASFNYSISFENGQVQLVVSLDINTSIIAPDDYEAIKEFFKIVVEKQNEKVVLKKI